MNHKVPNVVIFIALLCSQVLWAGGVSADIPASTPLLIVGGGTSGTAAALQAARMGTSSLVIEETPWIGGMLTSAGVSAVDGNYNLRGGLWGEFVDSLVAHYGSLDALKTGWVSNVMFEPSVGQRIFRNMIARHPGITLLTNTTLISLGRDTGRWVATVKDQQGQLRNVVADVVIDATELGDAAKMAGVKYDVGMESRHDTHEEIAPDKANNIVQDLTYVAILKDYGRDVSIPCPEGYDSANFACCAENTLCITPKEPDRMWSPEKMITYGKLPNKKYMINWPIEGNDYYVNLVDMSREEREKALQKAKDFTLQFVYFLQSELGFKNLGLADDEYDSSDRLPYIPYHRESRRIHGLVRFDLNHLSQPYEQPDPLYRTSISVGDYPVDHHHTRYNDYEQLPNLYFQPVPSFGVPMGCLLPADTPDMIVAEKSISVSNIVNGATRLQPVVLQIGQASGAIAALSLRQGVDVRQVDVRPVQQALLDDGAYILPYLDVEPGDKIFKPLQRIGATGLLHSTSKRVNWSNQTWIHVDSVVVAQDIARLAEYYNTQLPVLSGMVTVKEAVAAIAKVAGADASYVDKLACKIWKEYFTNKYQQSKPIKRGEYAVLVDAILDPFGSKPITITGHLK